MKNEQKSRWHGHPEQGQRERERKRERGTEAGLKTVTGLSWTAAGPPPARGQGTY